MIFYFSGTGNTKWAAARHFVLQHRAGAGVDLVVIFHIAGFELDLVDERAVLVVQLDLHRSKVLPVLRPRPMPA